MNTKFQKTSNILVKALLVIVLVALSITSIFTAPALASMYVLAEAQSKATSALKLLNMPKTTKVNNAVKVPFGSTDDGTVKFTIKNPKGVVVFDSTNITTAQNENVETDSTGNKFYNFTPDKIGTYSLVYSVASVGKQNLSEQTYKLTVTGEKPTLEFAENSKQIIPAKTNEKQIVLPMPVAKNANGQEVVLDSSNFNITVQDTATFTTYTSALAGSDYFIKEVEGKYAFTPNADNNCTYVVTYTFTDVTTGLTATKDYEVKYEKNYDPSNIELAYKLSASMPESMELGQEVTLPTVSISDKKDTDLSLTPYVDYSVVFVPNSKNVSKYTLDAGKNYVTVANSNVFTPMYPSSDGIYKVVLKVYTFFDSENAPSKTLEYSINDVKDSTKPEVYAVKDYKTSVTFEDEKVTGIDSEFEYTDVSYEIPSQVRTGTVVKLPAIYAKDAYTKYEKLDLERRVIPETGAGKTVTTILEDRGEGEKEYTVGAYETASYKFEKAGTYTIRYQAEDEAGNANISGLNFTIVVSDDFEDTLAPRITLSNVSARYREGEKVTFNKPTVVDYKTTKVTETETVDKNVEVGYYYYTGVVTDLDAELNKARLGQTSALVKVLEDEDNKNKLSFEMPSTDVTFVCVAYDDSGNIAKETRVIEAISTVSDTEIPTVVTTDENYVDKLDNLELEQDTIITLPEMEFSDNNPSSLGVVVKVLDKDGSQVSVLGTSSVVSGSKLLVSNSQFVASKSGEYTIIYTVDDIGGNYLVKSYIINVKDTRAPSIIVETSQNDEVEVGEIKKLAIPTVKDDGVVLDNPTWSIKFVGNNNPSRRFDETTMEFIALEAGTYTYVYTAEDASGNSVTSDIYTIVAKDTIKPTIELDYEVPLYKKLEVVDNEKQAIILPGFTAEDTLNGIKEYKVEVQTPTSKITAEKKDDGTYSFVPTTDGIYTITYIAIDNANNKTELTRTIKVGDNNEPDVVISNEAQNAPKQLKTGEKLILDFDSITVVDNSFKADFEQESNEKKASALLDEKTNDNSYKMFSVKVTNAEGTTVSANSGTNNEFNLDTAGKYTITYTARDKAGNIKQVTKYVEVVAKDSKLTIANETWGVVLIVVSALILGGVVIYFVRTRDRKVKTPVKKDEDKK